MSHDTHAKRKVNNGEKPSCVHRDDKPAHLYTILFISVARLMYTLHLRQMHLRLQERGVTCYFGACRNQTHISCVPLSCHRYKTTGASSKRSSLVVLFMAQYAYVATGKRRIAFNGTLQIGTISMVYVYSLVVTFSITRRTTRQATSRVHPKKLSQR